MKKTLLLFRISEMTLIWVELIKKNAHTNKKYSFNINN